MDQNDNDKSDGKSNTGSTINISGFPIPLKRTGGAIDRIFAIPLEAVGDALERKFKKNTESHIEAVQKKRKSKGKSETVSDPSVSTARQIRDWTANASEIDPADTELSALWRSILDEILDGQEDETDELMKAVKSLRTSDVRAFLRSFADSGLNRQPNSSHNIRLIERFLHLGYDDGKSSRLLQQGLVTRTYSNNFLAVLAALLVIFSIAAILIFDWLTSQAETSNFVLAFVTIIGCLTVLLFSMGGMYRPTVLGLKLCRMYEQYAKTAVG